MRTITEIYEDLAAEKAGMSELDALVQSEGGELDTAELLLSDLKSGSKVALWRLWLWLVAVATWINEQLMEQHKTEIAEIFATKQVHTLGWYASETLQYRRGVEMLWDGNRYRWPPDDITPRLVTFATATESGNNVIIKTAKGPAGSLVALAENERAALALWWSKWKDAGVVVEVVSKAADQLKVNMTIVRDRLILNSDNTLIIDPGVNVIEDAVAAFVMSLQFDGVLRLSRFTDFLQAARGVVDVQIDAAWHKPADGIYEVVDMGVIPDSGYFEIDYDASTINYTDLVNVGIGTE